jgi:hypothetical protein
VKRQKAALQRQHHPPPTREKSPLHVQAQDPLRANTGSPRNASGDSAHRGRAGQSVRPSAPIITRRAALFPPRKHQRND